MHEAAARGSLSYLPYLIPPSVPQYDLKLQVRRAMFLRVLVAVLASTASAFVVSPRPTAPTLSAVAEVRTAAPQMFLG